MGGPSFRGARGAAQPSRWQIAGALSDGPARIASLGVGVAALFALLGAAVWGAGGVNHLNPSILLIPALVAAWVFGLTGGVGGGVVAGLIAGPWMPASGAAPQPTGDWLVRLAVYAAVGTTAGLLAYMFSRQLRDTQRERNRIDTLRSIDLAILRSRDSDELFGGLASALNAVDGVYGTVIYSIDGESPLRLRMRTPGTFPTHFNFGEGRHRLEEMAREHAHRALSEGWGTTHSLPSPRRSTACRLSP
jgi:hypothetical protein